MARFSLDGKVALVTGAARGIGFETARLIHERGGSVVILDVNPAAVERAVAQIGARATGVAADVTDKDAMGAAVQTAVDTYGGLDLVVANAGVGNPPSTMLTADPEVWERTLEIDLLGVWRTVQPSLEQIAARKGQVAVISSVYAFSTGFVSSPYAVAKAGVEAMGRALRVELAIHGAGATVAHFGFVDTQMVRQAFDDNPQGAKSLESLPAFVRRRLTPAEAAEALVGGIERRAPRVIAPSFWKVPYFLRGVFGPVMDLVTSKDRRVRESLRELEARDRSADRSTDLAA